MARAALQSTFKSLKCVVYQNITHIHKHTQSTQSKHVIFAYLRHSPIQNKINWILNRAIHISKLHREYEAKPCMKKSCLFQRKNYGNTTPAWIFTLLKRPLNCSSKWYEKNLSMTCISLKFRSNHKTNLYFSTKFLFLYQFIFYFA